MNKLILAAVILLLLEGCSYLLIAKECAKVQDSDKFFVCRQVKPWE